MLSVGKISKKIYTYGDLVLVKFYKTCTYTPLVLVKKLFYSTTFFKQTCRGHGFCVQ